MRTAFVTVAVGGVPLTVGYSRSQRFGFTMCASLGVISSLIPSINGTVNERMVDINFVLKDNVGRKRGEMKNSYSGHDRG